MKLNKKNMLCIIGIVILFITLLSLWLPIKKNSSNKLGNEILADTFDEETDLINWDVYIYNSNDISQISIKAKTKSKKKNAYVANTVIIVLNLKLRFLRSINKEMAATNTKEKYNKNTLNAK